MSAPQIDRILVEASPGEVRAVGFAGDAAWDIALERPLAGPQAGDIYRARAGAVGPGDGRFFDMGGGHAGLARRPRSTWTEGAYGLVQVIRGDAGDKGPRVTDRVWLGDRGMEVSLEAKGAVEDRVEIARRIHHTRRDPLREELTTELPDGHAIKVAFDPGAAGCAGALAHELFRRIAALVKMDGPARRVHAAAGEVGWLAMRWPEAEWIPADQTTAAWVAKLMPAPKLARRPDPTVGAAIDAEVADALTSEIGLPDGARLWIEPTHALVAIDIDRAAAVEPMKTNIVAAEEIARQLRVRRLGGIVAIDFLRDGQLDGLAALSRFAEGDAWPWAPPKTVDPSGIVSFQRARLGASLSEWATGVKARVYRALRAVVRAAAQPPRVPRGIRAAPAIIHLMQTEMAPAIRMTEQQLGRPLDLERAAALGSIDIVTAEGEILEQA